MFKNSSAKYYYRLKKSLKVVKGEMCQDLSEVKENKKQQYCLK